MKVGILGGGQLGRMLALAGYPLGLSFRFLDPAPGPPVEGLAELVSAGWEDQAALEAFVRGLDVVTYEFENVPAEAAAWLGQRAPVHPAIEALRVAQDRLAEKQTFQALGIHTNPFHAVDSRRSLDVGVARLGLPAVLKTRRGGYDGKGQMVLRSPADLEAAWQALGGVPLLLEGFVPFTREVSQVAVRGLNGDIRCYPLVENHHAEGILRLTIAPAADVSAAVRAQAEEAVRRLMEHFGYVGVLALELFQVGDELLANEMAPRVHNSGHWTIEGARTSQFENHLRAITGWPLGVTEAVGHSAMVNLIGTVPEEPRVLAIPGAHLHLYGKPPRPGRKLGHVTLWADTPQERDERLARLRQVLSE
jgi:5-(carboxyamino)imidazole ribonucleotide synthase